MELKVTRRGGDQIVDNSPTVWVVPSHPEGAFTAHHTGTGPYYVVTNRLRLHDVSDEDIAAIEAGDPDVQSRLVQSSSTGELNFVGRTALFPIERYGDLLVTRAQELVPYAPVEETI